MNINLDEIKFPRTDNFSDAVNKHIRICSELFAITRKPREYRAESVAESKRRYYWNKKFGKQLNKLEFWTAAPALIAGAICVSSVEEAEKAFLSGAKKPEARRYVLRSEKNKTKKKRDYTVLSPRNFIRVRVLTNGQNGVVTAYRNSGLINQYRVTIDPKVSWKNKFRRWMTATDLQILDGKELPK